MHHAISKPHVRIRQARSKTKLSQTSLAEVMDVHRSAVSQWESASGNLPTVENLLRIAEITDVSFEWLALGRGSMRLAEGTGETPALELASFARDWHEERLLSGFRELPASGKKALVDFLETISRQRTR